MSAGVADFRLDDTAAAAIVLREATARYEVAKSKYWQQRELGGIVEATDADDMAHGVKYRAATPDGAKALARWQRAKAERDQAMRVRHREIEGRL